MGIENQTDLPFEVISELDPTGRIKLQSKSDAFKLRDGYYTSWYKVKSNKQGNYVEIRKVKYYIN